MIPVYIEKRIESGNHPLLNRNFETYHVTLGLNNEFYSVCIEHDDATILFTLDNPQYEFVDIRYYENGLVSTQVVQYEVHEDYIRAVYQRQNENNLKYTIVFREKRSGTIIYLDPDWNSGSSGSNPP